MKINKKYLLSFFVLLLIEITIALYIKDRIIRPFIGDILVVILLYTLIKVFMKKSYLLLPLYIFIFATIVEILQYFHIVDILKLQNNKVISTIIGTSFDFRDILCYLIGCIVIVFWEKLMKIISLNYSTYRP